MAFFRCPPFAVDVQDTVGPEMCSTAHMYRRIKRGFLPKEAARLATGFLHQAYRIGGRAGILD